jgi:hypothetical protein
VIPFVERLVIRLTVSVGWALSPWRVPEVIRGFQATEADGVWHLYRGMPAIESPRQRAIVFGHCLEEESHADAFARAYQAYGDRVFSPLFYERRPLYPAGEPVWKTFAFVHVGEVDATARFRALAAALPPGALKDCLGTVVSDEEGHVDLTGEMLLKMGARRAEIRREIWRVRFFRLWERWLRLGKGAIDGFATVLLSLVYYAFGFLLRGVARRRMTAGFVGHDHNVMKRL